MLGTLKALAAERSSERRVELLRRITDLFLAQPQDPSAAESFLFSEIMDRVLDSIAPTARAGIAEQVASSPRTPLAVARRLALDTHVPVARPVLMRSPALGESDLVDIASRAGDGHLQAIACRNGLSSRITDVLIDRGSHAVLRTVSGNHSAELSASGLRTLSERARDDDFLGALLANRPDLPQAFADHLAEGLARRGVETGARLSAELADRARERFQAELRNRHGEARGARQLIDAVEDGTLTLDAALTVVIDAGRLLDAAALVAHFLDLDRNFVFQMIVNGEIASVALAFRALELSHDTLSRTLALRARKRQEPGPGPWVLPDDYEAIDAAIAQRTIRFLKVRFSARTDPAMS